MPELVLILVIALIVLGPTKLPEIARALGRGMAEFRRAADDLRDNLMAEDRKREETTYAATPSAAAGDAEAGAAPPLTSSGATVGQAPPETSEHGAGPGAEGEPAAADASPNQEVDYVGRELDLGGDREAASADDAETRAYDAEPGVTLAEAGEAPARPPAEDRPADERGRPA